MTRFETVYFVWWWVLLITFFFCVLGPALTGFLSQSQTRGFPVIYGHRVLTASVSCYLAHLAVSQCSLFMLLFFRVFYTHCVFYFFILTCSCSWSSRFYLRSCSCPWVSAVFFLLICALVPRSWSSCVTYLVFILATSVPDCVLYLPYWSWWSPVSWWLLVRCITSGAPSAGQTHITFCAFRVLSWVVLTQLHPSRRSSRRRLQRQNGLWIPILQVSATRVDDNLPENGLGTQKSYAEALQTTSSVMTHQRFVYPQYSGFTWSGRGTFARLDRIYVTKYQLYW